MVRPSEQNTQLSLLLGEVEEEVAMFSLKWLTEATQTPEGTEEAYTRILTTIRKRDHALKRIQAYDAQV